MKKYTSFVALTFLFTGCTSIKYPNWESVSIESSVENKPCISKNVTEACTGTKETCDTWFKKRATIFKANTVVTDKYFNGAYFECNAGLPLYSSKPKEEEEPKSTITNAFYIPPPKIETVEDKKPKVDINDVSSVANFTMVKYDEFEKTTKYTGPNASGNEIDYLLIRGWKRKSGIISYQIYVSDYYPLNWHFYNRAFDSNGELLDMVTIDREVESCHSYCSYRETIGLTVTRNYLEKAKNTGIRFKLSGKSGEDAIFSIPAAYIKGFLFVAK